MESIKMAALVPHGNIAAELESERKRLFSRGLLPFYPFVCPLRFFPANRKSNYDDSITSFADFFQSNAVVAGKPAVAGNFVRRPLLLVPDRKTVAGAAVFFAGPFELRTFSFLYGAFPALCGAEPQLFPSADLGRDLAACNEIPLRVFKIAVFSLFFAADGAASPFRCEWTEEAARWVKIPKN